LPTPPPISRVVTGSRSRAASFRRTIAGQPSWVIRVALTAFLLVIAVPVALLLVIALAAAALVFAVLAVLNRLWSWAVGALAPGEWRENVRVLPPRPSDAGE
jgi:hypothetical protein